MNGKAFLIIFGICLVASVIGALLTANPKWLALIAAGFIVGLLVGVIAKKDDGPPIRGSHSR